jgi:hypothetical protein
LAESARLPSREDLPGGTTRFTVNFDLYNATNSNTVLTLNNALVPAATGNTWQVPTAILQPRFWKIGGQFDF